jgi:nucleotide-binding universal stress UspA family protein
MVKIERILCPVDLTSESEEALRYAVALARVYEARLMLCRCGARSSASAGAEGGTERHFGSMFEDALARHLGMTDFAQLDWEGFLLEGDDPGALITREAAERRADLIVMRSRRRPYTAALLGSTAETVCRTAPCSVLVTHPREREWVGASAGDICLERVLVAHDFSDRSELGLQYGASLAGRFGAGLHLLHVLREPERDAPELAWAPGTEQGLYQCSVRRLQVAAPSDIEGTGQVKPVVLRGRPYEEILSYARENEIDQICMGSDGVGRGPRALFGSNVDRVLRQSSCPVLVARPFKPAALQDSHADSLKYAAGRLSPRSRVLRGGPPPRA